MSKFLAILHCKTLTLNVMLFVHADFYRTVNLSSSLLLKTFQDELYSKSCNSHVANQP